jgi:uncharacterized protein YndB with AHSA1/START domain
MAAGTIVTVLEFRTELGAPPERVFAALTEAAGLERWFCDAAEIHATNGGRLRLSWKSEVASLPFEGRWVVFEPPHACAYEGGHAGYPDGYGGRVGFELSPRPGGTTLVTRHRLPARPDYEPFAATYRAAWPRALARLSEYLA